MSFAWPLFQGAFAAEALSVDTATSSLATLTAGIAPADGAWVELTPSTPFGSQAVMVQIGGVTDGGQNSILVDIGVGPGGSEIVIIPNLLLYHRRNSVPIGVSFTANLYIPPSVRVAARAKANDATDVEVGVTLFSGSFLSGPWAQGCITIGANTANGLGTLIDPGAVANTKGAWSELTPSLTRQLNQPSVFIGGSLSGGLALESWLVDVGIGAGGSERVIIPDLYVQSGGTSDDFSPKLFSMPVTIPEGVRVAARAQSTETNGADRVIAMTITGAY